jgi:hypothetical protein
LTYSTYAKGLLFAFAGALLCASSCGSKSASSDGGCTPGTAYCPCLNGGCNGGLTCATNLNECVQLARGSSGGNTGSGATTAAGGTTGSGGSTGGVTGAGGSKGGNTGTGGAVGSGGITGSGGKAGTTGSGGSASGGTSGTGGSGKGGAIGSGGTGSGGSPGSGGSSSGGSTGSGGSNVMQPPPITNGMSGWASRYWDCCKPACGWKGNVSGGNPMMSCDINDNSLGSNYDAVNACQGGGTAFMCWSGVPWSLSDTLSYGYAAASGNNYACGRCYQIQFTGTNNMNGDKMGTPALNGKTMIVQVINNGGVQATQFDLLIPGGGVGALNACSTQWGSSVDLGTQYGGWLSECNGSASCVQQKCQAAFSNKPDLMNGCNWFLNWFGASNNPDFAYQQVACPSALTQASGLSDPG